MFIEFRISWNNYKKFKESINGQIIIFKFKYALGCVDPPPPPGQ